jgi:hypothetical protein
MTSPNGSVPSEQGAMPTSTFLPLSERGRYKDVEGSPRAYLSGEALHALAALEFNPVAFGFFCVNSKTTLDMECIHSVESVLERVKAIHTLQELALRHYLLPHPLSEQQYIDLVKEIAP